MDMYYPTKQKNLTNLLMMSSSTLGPYWRSMDSSDSMLGLSNHGIKPLLAFLNVITNRQLLTILLQKGTAQVQQVLRIWIRDPVLFLPLDPEILNRFFRIPDLRFHAGVV